ncbi:MAG: hypothetical protein HUJ22_02845 [Gracilimonas sp.]|uniref:hypothetical protein n=1 Tax=Gracilimonas sp. TaxID=1974203 RepID=UPI001988C4ED|nr:hypothetical protein [Gracilimonas sp.]MBD3615483.1 hypothetical protein [Gracilimonas sp.]
MKKIILLLTWFLSSAVVGVAQITIAPTNLFIDHNNRFGTYLVINNSDQNQEISIDFLFAYSQIDENGNRTTVSSDTALEKEHSIASAIRAFPQNFILTPNTRQVVRIRVNPPNDFTDGTYWARIKTLATPESRALEITTEDNVSAQVGIRLEQITGLYYKKGQVSTGIVVDSIRPSVDDQLLTVLTDYKRTGNSPFLGTITASLIDNAENTITQNFNATTLYFDGTHKMEMDLSEIPSGEYTVKVNFETRRSDISQDDLVQMEPVTATTTVTIP